MNKKLKSGLLLLMLAGPLLFYISFHLLGDNHYSIPTYHPIDVTEGNDTIFYSIPNYELINSKGKLVSSKEYSGKFVVVSFINSSDSVKYSSTMRRLFYLQNGFRNHEEVSFVSFTKPEYSSSITSYSELFNTNLSSWELLLVDNLELKLFADNIYKVNDIQPNLPLGEKLVLIDKYSNIRGYYDGRVEKEVEKLLSEIRILLYEQSE